MKGCVAWEGLFCFPSMPRWVETAQLRLFHVVCSLGTIIYNVKKPRLQILPESACWNLFLGCVCAQLIPSGL